MSNNKSLKKWMEPAFAFAGVCVIAGFMIRAKPDLINPSLPEENAERTSPRGQFDQMFHFEEANSLGDGGRPTYFHRYDFERTGYLGLSGLSVPVQEIWRTENFNVGIHSASKSTPAVDESGIYVGSDASWFYAFEHDGSVRWKFHAGRAVQGFHGTAALDEKYVYVGAYNGNLYCLRKSDGVVVWVTKLADAIGSAPFVHGDSVYSTAETGATRNGYAARLDRRTGKIIWQSNWIGEQVHASLTMHSNGLFVYYGANNGNVVALSTATGEEAWRYRGTQPVKGSLTFHDGALYFGSWEGTLHKLNAVTGAEIWKKELMGRSQSSPVIFAKIGLIALASGSDAGGGVIALRLDSGEEAWRREIPGKARLIGSGTGVVDARSHRDVLWIGCETQKLCAMEAASGRILQEIALPGALTGVPTVFKDRVFVALDEGGLLAYQSKAKSDLAQLANDKKGKRP